MKLKKEQISNIIWIVAILILLFTPLGFHAKVWVNRIISSTPKTIAEGEQQKLEDYNFFLEDLNGKTIRFENFSDEVLLINYWATWCPPCVAEMPDMTTLHASYGDKVRFAFIANDEPQKVRQYLDKKGYDIPVYFERGPLPELIDATSLPTTFVIGRDGSIVIKKIGAANWNSTEVHAVLDKLTTATF